MEWIDKNYWKQIWNCNCIYLDQDYFKEQIEKNNPNDYFFKTNIKRHEEKIYKIAKLN